MQRFKSKSELTFIMIDIATISSKGQIVIPKKVREEAGLAEQDKVLIISEKNKIILEKISEEEARKNLRELMDYFREKFKEAGITRDDVKKEIEAVRKHAKNSS